MHLEPLLPEASVSLQALDSVSNPLLLDSVPNPPALVSLGRPPPLLALVQLRIPALGLALPTPTRVAGCSASPNLNKVLHCLVRPIPTLAAVFSARHSLNKTLVVVSLAATQPPPIPSVVPKLHNSLRLPAPLEGLARVNLPSEAQELRVSGQAVPERAPLVKQGPVRLVSAASVRLNRNNSSNNNNLRQAADYLAVGDLASSHKDCLYDVTDSIP